MAKPPEAIQFRKEDFPPTALGTPQALDALFVPLNRILDTTRQCLAQGIGINDNCAFEVRTVRITTPADDLVYPGVGSGPAFASGNYTAYSGREAGFSKRADGWGQFNGGLVAIGAAVPTDNQLIFTLPAAYWPAKAAILPSFTVNGSSKDVFASVAVEADGTVKTRFLTTWFANSVLGFAGAWPCADRTPVPLSCFPVDVELRRVRAPAGIQLLSLKDVTNPLSSPALEPVLALGGLKSVMLGATSVRLQHLPGLLLGRSYEVTFCAYT